MSMPIPQTEAQATTARLSGQLMQKSLRALLDRVRGSRAVLPHLAALENSLGKHGSGVIDTITPPMLAKICSQLSSLPLPTEDPPLHDLLTRLLDALEASRPTPQFLSTFVGEDTLVIREGSHSEFMSLAQDDPPAEPGHRVTDR